MLLYADEDFSLPVVKELRQLGHDVPRQSHWHGEQSLGTIHLPHFFERGAAMTIHPGQGLPDPSEDKPTVTSRPLTPLEWRMVEDLDWARTAPEVQQHEGKLVVVRDKRVIAVGDDESALRKQAAAQEHCSEWDFIVEMVPTTEYLLNPD